MAMQQGVTHWTSTLSGTQHATTKLGARFHFRGLFLRQIDFSFDELSFIITYLANETTICEQPCLEAASRMKMQHLHRGEEHVIWLTSMETPRSCILLYGNAEARPLNIATTPVLNFTEGSVVGNLGAPQRVQSASSEASRASSSPNTAQSISGVSDSKWRRIKRENSLRKGIHLYNKIIISGPADYIVLTASDIRESGSGAADRLQWAKQFGLERFIGCLRQTVFEPGTIIVHEGHQLNNLYLLLEGECRAFRWSDDSQLPVASLGPKSTVGDISLMLGIPEPVTVRAVTTVNALTLSQEDFIRETSDRHDPTVVACIEIGFKLHTELLAEKRTQQREDKEVAHLRNAQQKILGKKTVDDFAQLKLIRRESAATRSRSLHCNGKTLNLSLSRKNKEYERPETSERVPERTGKWMQEGYHCK
ncbi:hypothetical protein AM588_10009570 [Phytophthora nicotianae]|uniref:Cyclic nucleotide-binding domain-containing protein n=1 Tax=Phytophthora nicotianae TaxID=4792 RepID=A0A0W8DM91_PHYNI|nr:hypothetical protein AM588_10009570 [Phytophthora nicotianae]